MNRGALENFKRFQQLNPNEAQKEGLKIAKQLAKYVAGIGLYGSGFRYQDIICLKGQRLLF